MNKCFLVLLLTLWGLFVLPLPVHAQNDAAIRGIVTAKADGSRLPNVDVQLESPILREQLRTKTDDTGQFSFQRLVPGPYVLDASRSEFQGQKYNSP